MNSRLTFVPLMRHSSLAVIAIALACPASAHHMGPSGVGAGGGMTVFGPATLDEGHGSLWFRFVDTRPDQRSDSELQALAVQGVDAHNTSHDLNAGLGAAYGITHELTISVEVPYVRHDSIRATEPGLGGQHLGSVGGIGDINLLAKYRITPEGPKGFVLIGGVKVPTGSTHERDRFGKQFETEHQPGTGSWDPIFGASAGAKLGGLNLAASAIYQLAGEGAQRTRLGNRLQGGIAISRHFGRAEEDGDDDHDHAADQERHVHSSSWDAFVEVAGEVEGRQRIGSEVEQDSGGKWAWVSPGVTFTAASGWSASAALAVPVWQRIRSSHPKNAYRFMLSLGHGF